MKGLFIRDYVEGSWEPGVDLEKIGLLQVHRLPALRQTCQGEGQVVPERTRPMGLAEAGGGGVHQSLRTGQEQGQLQVDSQFADGHRHHTARWFSPWEEHFFSATPESVLGLSHRNKCKLFSWRTQFIFYFALSLQRGTNGISALHSKMYTEQGKKVALHLLHDFKRERN